MQVTITLGSKAMEFVAGIPKEELPEILSDVLERSLLNQVRPLTSDNQTNKSDDEELLKQLREVLKEFGINVNQSNSIKKDDSTISDKSEVRIKKVESSAFDSLADGLDFFKGFIK